MFGASTVAAGPGRGCALPGPVILGVTVGAPLGALELVTLPLVPSDLDGGYLAGGFGVDRDGCRSQTPAQSLSSATENS